MSRVLLSRRLHDILLATLADMAISAVERGNVKDFVSMCKQFVYEYERGYSE